MVIRKQEVIFSALSLLVFVFLVGAEAKTFVIGMSGESNGTDCEPDWVQTFGPQPGVSEGVTAFATFDDGSGPALFAAGGFTSAGGVSANYIAKWEGSGWSPLGPGTNNGIGALAVFDDGGGPALYVGGEFTQAGGVSAKYIAKWDGSSWTPLGSGLNAGVYAMAVFDDGSGTALYVGGSFTTAGGTSAKYIARWNGTNWSAVGAGMNNLVTSLAVFEQPDGATLCAGGSFSVAGTVNASRVAMWNGLTWSAIGTGMNNTVFALAVVDDGGPSGDVLYAAGKFTTAGGVQANRIAQWNGTTWSTLGSGVDDAIHALTVYDDGSGRALFAGGAFNTAGGANAGGIAKWNGSSWTSLGSGADAIVAAFGVFDGPDKTPALFVGGYFRTISGIPAMRIARWNGIAWSALGEGLNNWVFALATHDDGSGKGTNLYAGGAFTNAAGVAANRIAQWTGSTWLPLGMGMNASVKDLAVFDDGNGDGSALYAAGSFTLAGGVDANSVAKWNGEFWSPLGTGIPGWVNALEVFDDGTGSGPELYAAGFFSNAGGVSAMRIAKWDGTTWSPLGSGMTNDIVALAVFDDGSGSGPALYAGGSFYSAGGIPARGIAKWDGFAWSPVGKGVDGGTASVFALCVFDDGSGPALYAGGKFTIAGSVNANYIAKWNGSSWSALGTGMNNAVHAITVSNDGDGTGPALFAGGDFTSAGGNIAKFVAKWDGSSWSSLGDGMNDGVHALVSVTDKSGASSVYVGGRFTVSPAGDSHLARWQGCPGVVLPCPPDITGDSQVNVADLLAVISAWGPCNGCAADINDDNQVNVADLLAVISAWGACP